MFTKLSRKTEYTAVPASCSRNLKVGTHVEAFSRPVVVVVLAVRPSPLPVVALPEAPRRLVSPVVAPRGARCRRRCPLPSLVVAPVVVAVGSVAQELAVLAHSVGAFWAAEGSAERRPHTDRLIIFAITLDYFQTMTKQRTCSARS